MLGFGGLVESVALVAECSNSTARHGLRRKIAQEEKPIPERVTELVCKIC
jgi:hypothetical protein